MTVTLTSKCVRNYDLVHLALCKQYQYMNHRIRFHEQSKLFQNFYFKEKAKKQRYT